MAFRPFRTMVRVLLPAALCALWLAPLEAQQPAVVMEHDGSTVMFEP